MEAPSPINATDTKFSPITLCLKAAPTAIGALAPTIAFAPSIPTDRSAMCIEPPLPSHNPSALQKISIVILSRFEFFAKQCPWPLCVLAIVSLSFNSTHIPDAIAS